MNRIALVCAAIIGLAGGIAASLLNSKPEPTVLAAGTLLEPPREIASFALTSGTTRFDNDSLVGQWQLVFFGFTRCPDICPTTLQLLVDARGDLSAQLEASQLPEIVLVSVDPEHDTPARLRDYTEFFDPTVRGVVGSDEELAAFSKNLGVLYQKIPLENGDYTMDHSGAVIAINPEGEWAAVFSPPLRKTALVNDLKQLLGDS
ncbi:MAG: SCO family protein [Pseudomonadota bacterium]